MAPEFPIHMPRNTHNYTKKPKGPVTMLYMTIQQGTTDEKRWQLDRLNVVAFAKGLGCDIMNSYTTRKAETDEFLCSPSSR